MSLKIKEFLDYKYKKYNNPSFIQDDPIQIPHLFQKKEDIEISAFLTATIAWGNRKSIIKSSKKIVEIFGNNPHEFIMNHNDSDLKKLESFNWNVQLCDGHDHNKIKECLNNLHPFKPNILIAETTKGKGVSFMENQVLWHYRSPNSEELKKALEELK